MLFIFSLEAIMLYSSFILVFDFCGRDGLMVLYYSKSGIQALIVTRVFCRIMMSMRFIILHSKALGWEGKSTTFSRKRFSYLIEETEYGVHIRNMAVMTDCIIIF